MTNLLFSSKYNYFSIYYIIYFTMRLKNSKQYQNKFFYIICFILICTTIFINKIGNKVSNNLIEYSKILIRNTITESINDAISIDNINKFNINDLIIFSYKENNIDSVDYNIENSYAFLSEVKKNLINIINNKYTTNNNKIIINTPFYNYTNNIILINLGPKVNTQIDILNTIDSSISTNVSYYGINTIKLDIYLNFNITSNIIVPFNKENVNNTYSVIICSKVINGNIPSYYGNGFRSESSNINL